jgi:hypothetical protein
VQFQSGTLVKYLLNKISKLCLLINAFAEEVMVFHIKGRVFENRVIRRMFGPKRDEVTGEWRKLHNVELHILYSPQILLGR